MKSYCIELIETSGSIFLSLARTIESKYCQTNKARPVDSYLSNPGQYGKNLRTKETVIFWAESKIMKLDLGSRPVRCS